MTPAALNLCWASSDFFDFQLAAGLRRAQHVLGRVERGTGAVASKDPKRAARSRQASKRGPKPSLKLLRTEPAGRNGILLVYKDEDGKEHTWLLEQTSSMEFMALLMQGRFKQGRRVVVEADVALEPPDEMESRAHLCFTAGPLESCVPIDRPSLSELRRNIDRFLDE